MRLLATFSFTVLWMSACTSPQVFICETNENCMSGDLVGRCEDNGHCSFPDDACESNFRFSEYSGPRSNVCVGNSPTDSIPDAGILDAVFQQLPIAKISEGGLACGKTSIQLSSANSEVFGGRKIQSYDWVLKGPDNSVLRAFKASAGESAPRGPYLLLGSIESPTINLTPYHDSKALFLPGGNEQSMRLYQEELELPAGQYRFYMAVAEYQNAFLSAGISIRLGDPIESESRFIQGFRPSEAMKMYVAEFELPTGLPRASLSLNFGFQGGYWLDHISLRHIASTGDETEFIINQSFENGLSPWAPEYQNVVESRNLPKSYLEEGTYTVTLQVTDSGGLVSSIDSVSFEYTLCPAG